MKPLDFEKIVFRLCVLSIAIVFLLSVPTTHIVADWFVQFDQFWKVPLLCLAVGLFLCLLFKLILPNLFRWGIFEERREQGRLVEPPFLKKLKRIFWSLCVLAFQVLGLLLVCLVIIYWMQTADWLELFRNL